MISCILKPTFPLVTVPCRARSHRHFGVCACIRASVRPGLFGPLLLYFWENFLNDVPFEGFIGVGQSSRSRRIDELSLDNLLFLALRSTKCSWRAFVIAQCPSSVVHNFFKHFLLLNHWVNLDETKQGCSFGKALPNLFKRLNSNHNSCCHGNQKEKHCKIFENLLL